jgi:hypothetical protein
MKKKQNMKISNSSLFFDDNNMINEGIINANLHKFKNSIFAPTQQEGDMAAFYQMMKSRNMSIIRKKSSTTDIFSNRNSFYFKELAGNAMANEIPNNGKLIYSFRDDMTMDNENFNQEDEYERTRLNSKSIIDMSKIDWSASVVSKNPSVFHGVIL